MRGFTNGHGAINISAGLSRARIPEAYSLRLVALLPLTLRVGRRGISAGGVGALGSPLQCTREWKHA